MLLIILKLNVSLRENYQRHIGLGLIRLLRHEYILNIQLLLYILANFTNKQGIFR